jgi:hypothetical protein
VAEDASEQALLNQRADAVASLVVRRASLAGAAFATLVLVAMLVLSAYRSGEAAGVNHGRNCRPVEVLTPPPSASANRFEYCARLGDRVILKDAAGTLVVDREEFKWLRIPRAGGSPLGPAEAHPGAADARPDAASPRSKEALHDSTIPAGSGS